MQSETPADIGSWWPLGRIVTLMGLGLIAFGAVIAFLIPVHVAVDDAFHQRTFSCGAPAFPASDATVAADCDAKIFSRLAISAGLVFGGFVVIAVGKIRAFEAQARSPTWEDAP